MAAKFAARGEGTSISRSTNFGREPNRFAARRTHRLGREPNRLAGKNQIFRRGPFRSSDHYNHTPVSTIFRGGIRHETDDGFNFVRNIVKTDVDGNNYRAQTFFRTVIVIDGDAKTRPGKLCASDKSNQRRRALK